MLSTHFVSESDEMLSILFWDFLLSHSIFFVIRFTGRINHLVAVQELSIFPHKN